MADLLALRVILTKEDPRVDSKPACAVIAMYVTLYL